jgi:hypothetical protein
LAAQRKGGIEMTNYTAVTSQRKAAKNEQIRKFLGQNGKRARYGRQAF